MATYQWERIQPSKCRRSHLPAASKMSHVVSLGPQNFAGIATVGGFSPSYLKDRLLKNGNRWMFFWTRGSLLWDALDKLSSPWTWNQTVTPFRKKLEVKLVAGRKSVNMSNQEDENL